MIKPFLAHWVAPVLVIVLAAGAWLNGFTAGYARGRIEATYDLTQMPVGLVRTVAGIRDELAALHYLAEERHR
jgi:hypothetical protein